MSGGKKTRIVVLGGGFGGVYAALELEKTFRRDPDIELVLVNKENFFLFTPMLHEVAASDLDVTHIVNPLRKLLKRTNVFVGDVLSIDLERKVVLAGHGVDDKHPHELHFDHLVLALGSTTNFYGLPGLEQRAFTMKSLGDAIALRNRMIENLEEADFECCKIVRERMMTYVVAGGGFAGVETVAGMNDFVREVLHYYGNLAEKHVRVVLVHPGKVILPELSEKLGRYAQEKLAERGVEIHSECKVKSFTGDMVELSDGTKIRTRTLVWTAGTSPNPLLAALACAKERGKLKVDVNLELEGHPGIWALGDCALVPDPKSGGFHPPTAQHACRQGKIVAHNIAAAIHGRKKKAFTFASLGQLASLGRRSGVANVLGLQFSGFLAWWLWRTIYLSKLPRFERKFRVALDWTINLVFSKEIVQTPTSRGPGLVHVERVLEAPPIEERALQSVA